MNGILATNLITGRHKERTSFIHSINKGRFIGSSVTLLCMDDEMVARGCKI